MFLEIIAGKSKIFLCQKTEKHPLPNSHKRSSLSERDDEVNEKQNPQRNSEGDKTE
jgi:hypothetical protein